METKYGYWKGVKLEDYTKEELLDIMVEMGEMQAKLNADYRQDVLELSLYGDTRTAKDRLGKKSHVWLLAILFVLLILSMLGN